LRILFSPGNAFAGQGGDEADVALLFFLKGSAGSPEQRVRIAAALVGPNHQA
jgi:hypothetical protein